MTGWIKTSLGELCHITMGQSPPSNTNEVMKELRINNEELPKGWINTTIGEVFEFEYGKGLTKAKRNENGKFPVYGSNGIVGYHNEFLIEAPALIVGRKGAAGEVSYSDKNCWPIDTTYFIKNLNNLNIKFAFYFLKSLMLAQYDRSTAIPGLNRNDAYGISFNLPPLFEQHQIIFKIEELFSELDNGVESLKKARQQLKTYRQAVLKHAFEGKLTQEWREQQIEAGNPPEPAKKLLERIKKEREADYQKQVEEWKKACKQAQRCGSKKPAKPRKPKDLPPLTKKELDELPELPEGWGWSYLDYCGYWIGGGTPSKQRKEYWLDGDVLWVSPKDMKNQYIKITIDKITKTAVKESSAKLIPSGSVLFVVRSGILRRTLPVSITTEISTVNQDLQAFTPFKVFPEYIYWYCVANEFHIRNNCAKSGTTVESIETTQLKKYRISVCSPEEQQAIVSEIETRLSVCDQLEQTIEDSLKKAEALRQSILKKAFEGELTREWRLAHPELISGENSAESLLARIRAEKAQLKWIKR